MQSEKEKQGLGIALKREQLVTVADLKNFENVVYQRTFTTLPVAQAEKISEVIEKSKQQFTIGLDKAEKCYQGARHYQQI